MNQKIYLKKDLPMKFYPAFFGLALLLLANSATAQIVFKAFLRGHHEAMPVVSSGSGEVTATLNGNQLVVTGFFENLTGLFDASVAGGAHIHAGYAGENGGIEIALLPTVDADLKGGTFLAATNTFTLTNEQVALLQNRQLYVNIHTTAFASGELRGQLVPQADEYYFCNLFGSNHLPSVMTQGSGALMLELHGDQLVVSGSFANLSSDFDASVAGGAHLHLGLPGANGDIAVFLDATLDADLRGGVFEAANNTFTLSADQMAALQAREVYANIHTTGHAAGEIRGQVTGMARAVFTGRLSGSQEWPVVTSAADGRVQAELLAGDTLIVTGSFAGLESEVATAIAGGAHLHLAPAGSNGDVAVALDATLAGDLRGGSFEAENNTFALTSAQVQALLDRQCYVNIHTEGNQAGELRAQLLNQAQAHFFAFLAGWQEVPDVNTEAHGAVMAELSGETLVCSGSFDELGSAVDVNIAGGSHLHIGMPGQNGDVAFALTTSLDTDLTGGVFLPGDNTFSIDAELTESLMARALYVNVHTLENPGGEIRGNLLAEGNIYFGAPLSGASQTNPVNTDANGMVLIEVNGSQSTLVGSFANLASNFDASVAGGAHLHSNLAGSNGDIRLFLQAQTAADLRSGIFAAADNSGPITPGLLDTLRMRALYVNIHTEGNAAGELRGQCLPLAGTYFHTTLESLNEFPPAQTSAQGSMKFELTGNVLTCTGSFANLEGEFDANVAGGAHLHIGEPGANGDIALTLVPQLAADLKSGVFLAADNTFELTGEQTEMLRTGNFYVNIHSTTHAAGELRGQVLPEINLFPESTDITLPLPGISVDLSGAASTLLTIEWGPAFDPDGDPVNYIWQLALDAQFDNIIFMQNASDAQLFSATYGELDAALEAAGVSVGSNVTLYHRVVVSDGCNNSPGQANDAQFARGMVTGVREVLAQRFKIDALPNVVTDQTLRVRIAAAEAMPAQLLLLDPLGRILQAKNLQLQEGLRFEDLPMADYAAGTYYVALKIAEDLLPPQKVIKK
ncbi:MAG: CHRD domain-containing protein [Bacteroidetes bacterium]|nr:MAG: CHRD domain-containing protein [Bacteroidota bacterium]